jgi:hypothetical protein
MSLLCNVEHITLLETYALNYGFILFLPSIGVSPLTFVTLIFFSQVKSSLGCGGAPIPQIFFDFWIFIYVTLNFPFLHLNNYNIRFILNIGTTKVGIRDLVDCFSCSLFFVFKKLRGKSQHVIRKREMKT